MAKEKRIVWTMLGRIIGTASGWDQCDTFVMQLYDFEPAPGVELPAGTLCVDFENGVAETFTRTGKIKTSCDVVAAIASLPIQPRAT